MIKKIIGILVCTILVILVIPISAENGINNEIKKGVITNLSNGGWIKHFPGTSWAHVVRETDDGYVLVGATDKDDTGDGLIIKVDKNGNETWTTTVPNCAFEGLWVNSDNSYIVGGWQPTETDNWGILIKLYENGTIDWQQTYGESPGGGFIQVQQTLDRGYICGGIISNQMGNGWLLKTDADGTEIWNKSIGFENSSEVFHSIHETSDGGFILPGWSSTALGSDGWVVKTDSNGNEEWQQYYDTGTSIIGIDKIDNINMGRQDFDGGYIFTGWSSASFLDKGAFWILKTDENGNELWSKTYGRLFFHDLGLWIEPTTDGGYIAAGKKLGIGTLPNIILKGLWMPLWNNLWVIKTDSEGIILWDVTYRGATARCVQETIDGGYIIAGHKGPYYGTKGILLIKTDENGNFN